MTKKRIHLFIRGKVQGVFFRQAVKVTAKKNNIGGWARNLDDGRVEVLLEGDDEAVNAVIKWAHTCLLYTSPSPRDATLSRMPSSA